MSNSLDSVMMSRGISRMQLSGILSKQPFGPKNQSTKWNKRFFVLKDGYLLYYLDSDKKEFDRKQYINLHPKGILPLGGCSVQSTTEPGHPFCMKITSTEINNDFVICSETDQERIRWLNALTQSTRITWRNAQLGDAMIEQLEKQGLQMAKEKQQYVERLQSETEESSHYKAQAEELARLNEELSKENLKLEQLVQSMKSEHEELNREMQRTVKALQSVEEAKFSLHITFEMLQKNLEDLETQKHSIEDALQDQLMEARMLSTEKQHLSEETLELSSRLKTVERRMTTIAAERAAAERSLKDQEMKALQLLEEKRYIEDRADQLEESIQELAAQKASTEAELQEEIQARIEAENRLREAEVSLARLENVIKEQKESVDNKQMMMDVKNLRKFFEDLAFEEKLDARKCIMIKHSIQARKALFKRSNNLHASRRFERLSLPPLDMSKAIQAGIELPMSPSSSNSEMDTLFERSAQFCLSSPGVRHSVIGLLQELDKSNNRH